MNIRIYEDYEAVSRAAAEYMKEAIRSKPDAVIGYATGKSPIGMYRHLVEAVGSGELDMSRTVAFNLDEYCGLSEDHPRSYKRFMEEHLFGKVNIKESHIPNGNAKDLEMACRDYDARLESYGGIDVQILGIGENGHIGFNEPAGRLMASTHIERLDDVTRRNHADDFGGESNVPDLALSMGVGDILKSRRILVIATGKKKSAAFAAMMSGQVTTECPATLLLGHADVTVLVDREASGEISDQGGDR